MPSSRGPGARPSHRQPARPGSVRPQPARAEERSGANWLWLAPPPRATWLAGWALLPLRAFLGITFCFAGLQKLANPGFFRASNPASIQAQLAGAARHSPIHGLLGPLGHLAVPLGLLIAFGELAVGLGTLAGLYARVAAIGGMLLSFGLFLTVSFHTNPYYTGSDIVFVFAWTPLLVAGAGAVSADALIANLARKSQGLEPDTVVPLPFARVREVCGSYEAGSCAARRGAPCEPGPCPYLARQAGAPRGQAAADLDRRTLALKGALAAALGAIAVVGGGVIAGLGRLLGGSSAPASRSLGAGPGPSTTTTRAASAPSTSAVADPTTTAATHPPGTRLGPASAVPVGGAATFTDPASGDPALVVQPQRGTFRAFDAVCPHAGCTVEYSSHDRVFVCPCHGSQFNGSTGAVEVGPAQSGLARITIAEGSDGQLYAK